MLCMLNSLVTDSDMYLEGAQELTDCVVDNIVVGLRRQVTRKRPLA